MEKYIVIESDFFGEGLFGQILAWLIETLPTLSDADIKPEFLIKSKNYGDPEVGFNIIPHTIEYNYSPTKSALPEVLRPFLVREDKDAYYLTLNKIKHTNGHPSFKNFRPDFHETNQHFFRFFNIPEKILARANELIDANCNVLGVHYRGTDKLVDKYQNPNQSSDEDLFHICDSLIQKFEIDTLYLATDTNHIVRKIKDRYSTLKVLALPMSRFDTAVRIFEIENHKPIENSENAMVDCVALSKCSKVIMTNSVLSGFAKIFNPNLEIYRTCEFGCDWFPVHYIDYISKTDL